MSFFKAITNFFRAQPQFDLETGEMLPVERPLPGTHVTVYYPCGCSASGPATPGNPLSMYCSIHEEKGTVTK